MWDIIGRALVAAFVIVSIVIGCQLIGNCLNCAIEKNCAIPGVENQNRLREDLNDAG